MRRYFKTETAVAQNLIKDFFLTLTARWPFHRKDFKWKEIWGYGVNFWKKQKLCIQNLTKREEAANSRYSATGIFYNISILCLGLSIIRGSDQGVIFINFPSHILFNDININYRAALLKKNSLWLLPFYMAVAAYCYYV